MPFFLLCNATGSLSSSFTVWDWLVLIGYLALVTVLGIRLAGKQSTMEDFFRGGNRLPWYAVSGSMIATIISAVTFVGVPARAYDGNFTYLQFGIIAGLLSRLFVAFVLVPAYFAHHVYSPYDYMAKKLGESARSVTTALFSLMGLLAQASRVYLTAVILQLVLADPLNALEAQTGIDGLTLAVALVGLIAVVWTMLGGIATVIWTDVMLFLLFVVGGLVAIGVVAMRVPDGLGGILSQGWEAGKFQLFALSSTADASSYSPAWGSILCEPFTIWAAIFAVTFGNIGAYGTDQLLAQRIFTCRSQRDAKLAVLSSWAAELVAALMLLVGVGLWAFYRAFPEQLAGAAAEAVADRRDNIFPVFILTQVPVILRGLIVAGIFAAAISSLTSILAALSQTTISAVYLPWLGVRSDQDIPPELNGRILRISRVLILVWGIALCAMAIAINRYVVTQEAAGNKVFFLDLALGLASYVLGTLLAAFLLAWLPLGKNGYGLIWSAPLSVFCVYASRFHDASAWNICAIVAVILLISWIIAAWLPINRQRRWVLLGKTVWLALGCAALLWITKSFWFAQVTSPEAGAAVDSVIVKRSIAWPWYAPLGGLVAFVFGYLLGEPHSNASGSPS